MHSCVHSCPSGYGPIWRLNSKAARTETIHWPASLLKGQTHVENPVGAVKRCSNVLVVLHRGAKCEPHPVAFPEELHLGTRDAQIQLRNGLHLAVSVSVTTEASGMVGMVRMRVEEEPRGAQLTAAVCARARPA